MFPLRDINPTGIFPAITLAIIAVNVVVFFAVQPSETQEIEEFFYENAVIACELKTGDPLDVPELQGPNACIDEPLGQQPFPDKNVWLAAIVSMFLHGGLLHIGLNMWSFWIFGNNIEEVYGRVGFVALYFAAGIVATLGFVLFNSDSTVPLVGASGAIAGIMGAYAVLFPNHRILTIVFFYVVGIPAIVFLGLWFLLQFVYITGQDTNVAWEAHVFGFVFGALITLPLRTPLLRRTAEARALGTPADPFSS